MNIPMENLKSILENADALSKGEKNYAN